MIVYLQKVYAGEYPQQQPEKKESHWVRNGLLTTGALVGAHFGAKAGLLGRRMQKFAGNNQAWVGNKLGIYDIAKSGEKAATEAVAKMNAGVKGRGMDKAGTLVQAEVYAVGGTAYVDIFDISSAGEMLHYRSTVEHGIDG